MTEPTSLQALIRAVLDDSPESHHLSPRQWQVCYHIRDCRTEAMGGELMACDACAEVQPIYHSCRDRHCPRCQHRQSQRWCERQQAAVLPVTYHHLVFTLPDILNGWVEVHPKEIYALLFASVWATLSAFAANRLHGQLGMTAVLHTWGQTLTRHVHLHCLVPGGALGDDGTWHPATTQGLFPVRALSRHFRGGLVSRLRAAYQAGELSRLSGPAEVDRVLDALMSGDWVVFSKPCLTHTDTVVEYLGRYSHRIALSDSRLSDFDGTTVTLSYKDYRDDRRKQMQLAPEELLRRFLLHILPKGFMRVRHYGFLANRCRQRRLGQIRQALDAPAPDPVDQQPLPAPWRCRSCGKGHLHTIAEIPAQRPWPRRPKRIDSG